VDTPFPFLARITLAIKFMKLFFVSSSLDRIIISYLYVLFFEKFIGIYGKNEKEIIFLRFCGIYSCLSRTDGKVFVSISKRNFFSVQQL
jgi:hypothetical protein